MNPPYLKKYNSYNNSKNNKNSQKTKNKYFISESLSNLKKNHLKLNCKSPIKIRESELIIVKSLWNDLGVNIEYQNEFKKYYNELESDNEKMELILNEKNHLRNFRESLIKLSEEISNRDNNIFKLKKYCSEIEKHTYTIDNYINNYSNNSNTKSNNEIKEEEQIPLELFELIKKEIESYRINTVNVINRIIHVREISSYYELNKKWDPSKINRSYSFNQNYLLTMINDSEFFNSSILIKYLQTDNEIPKMDFFFSNCKYLVYNENTKLSLKINFELQGQINKCKYIIFQDNLLNNIKKEIDNKKMTINKRNSTSVKSRPVFSTGSNLSTISKKTESEVFLLNNKTGKKYYVMFGHNKVNLSRTLYYLKKTMGNKYQKMFYNENDLLNARRKLEIMNKFFPISNPDDEEFSDSNNENYNEEMNIIDNNRDNRDIKRGIMEYSNKNKLGNYYSNNNFISIDSDNDFNNNNVKGETIPNPQSPIISLIIIINIYISIIFFKKFIIIYFKILN